MYSYVCVECNTEVESREFNGIGKSHPSSACPMCDGRLVRYIDPRGFSVQRSMPEHFNVAVGKHIGSPSEMRSELSRAQDEMSERTGMDHKYIVTDPGDKESLGVTDEGLDSTAKVRRDSGVDTPTRQIIV